MLQDTDYYSYLICPFTGRKLRFLSDKELEVINIRIGNGELYFHPGIQVSTPLTQALVTEHQTYIYPVFNDIFYLKRETAIVAKNRTENYLKRISNTVIENFEAKYNFNNSGLPSKHETKIKPNRLASELAGSLRDKLPKRGNHFVSMCSNDIDAIHNLVFGTEYKHYIHVEFELSNLSKVSSDLKDKTVLVLADNGHLPFAPESIDALISFDPINQYNKVDQKVIYEDLKRAMNADGASIVLFDNERPLHTKVLLGADKLSKTARSMVMPWKKAKLPTFHFEGVQLDRVTKGSDQIVSKTSLNRQFS